MKSSLEWFSESKDVFKSILAFSRARRVPLYLVGGILRDSVIGRKKDNPDIDFCLKGNAVSFARSLARRLRCGFAVLDRIHGCGRVVKKIKGTCYTFDFTDFRAPSIEGDLLHRDFTINSMALPFENIFQAGGPIEKLFIDPYGGMRDIRARAVRLVNPKGFLEDPLRVLRAFSLAALFGFSIEKRTLALIKPAQKKITAVSFERIRDEMFKLFSSGRAHASLAQMEKYRIIDSLFPEIKPMRSLRQGPYHHLDVWKHTLETLKHLELILRGVSQKDARMKEYLFEEISYGRRRYELMKLAALLHDVGKPKTLRVEKGKISFHGHERVGSYMAEEAAKRLKLSNDEIRCLKQIIFAHLRPGFLSDSQPVTKKAQYRFFRDTGAHAVSVLLLSLADQRATKGRLATPESRLRQERLVRTFIKAYFTAAQEKKPPRLVNGHDLMKRFKLEPSIVIGKLLRSLDELQAIGKIKTKEEALKQAAVLIKKL